MVLGLELFTLGLLIFMLAYVLLRLLNERREHSRKREMKEIESRESVETEQEPAHKKDE
jgi:flagellar biogenesis protein FliO